MITALVLIPFLLIALRLGVAVVGMVSSANECEAHARAVQAERRFVPAPQVVYAEAFTRAA